jgi:ABC-type transport system involved in cytochrome c biogenesis ATPase subunit
VIAVSEIDLAIESGEFVTVVGPSGCGKTTLLRAIGGLEEPTAGTVRIDGESPVLAQASARLGFVFQSHTLLPWKSATENVTFLREIVGEEPRREEARALLESVGLDGFEDARPSELSGGMNQRVSIARAIHLGAEVLLMDEPFVGVKPVFERGEIRRVQPSDAPVEDERHGRNLGIGSFRAVFVISAFCPAVFPVVSLIADSGVALAGTARKRYPSDRPDERTSCMLNDIFYRIVGSSRYKIFGKIVIYRVTVRALSSRGAARRVDAVGRRRRPPDRAAQNPAPDQA